jgi:hypothetical protein
VGWTRALHKDEGGEARRVRLYSQAHLKTGHFGGGGAGARTADETIYSCLQRSRAGNSQPHSCHYGERKNFHYTEVAPTCGER